ncbi:pyrroline-5-carboxylate reductase family protein [Cobetia crustatorum]|uniref:pyrroline-5-carboxylate reductase family protein n=1 Tax=Cobetia crustatorum TaxID=553385 RepID=UPI00046860CF|nr:hypothetical protein [Cobetia crustatorum]
MASPSYSSPCYRESRSPPMRLGVLGVGELTESLLVALARGSQREGRSRTDLEFHLSPRNDVRSHRLGWRFGAVRHASNVAVCEASLCLLVGVRPDQLEPLASELREAQVLEADHHLMVTAAGVPLVDLQRWFAPARVVRVMTGLAVSEGQSALTLYPEDLLTRDLLGPAVKQIIAFAEEEAFEASMLAVCINAWQLAQQQALLDWFQTVPGMSGPQARQLLMAQLRDALALMEAHPDTPPGELASRIGTPGTWTARGLEQLGGSEGAHRQWQHVLEGLRSELDDTRPKNGR